VMYGSIVASIRNQLANFQKQAPGKFDSNIAILIVDYIFVDEDYSHIWYWSKRVANSPFHITTPLEQISFSSYAFIISSGYFAWKKMYYATLYASTSDLAKQIEYEALGGLTDIEAKRVKFLIPKFKRQAIGIVASPVFYLCWRFISSQQKSSKWK
jgi:hypothetical protein